MSEEPDFHGAKVAFFIDHEILVYRRDDNPEIPFPNMLDLPGGGRENGETGAECVARETKEEFGIEIAPDDLSFVQNYPNWRGEGKQALFFVGHLSPEQIGGIIFGDEGQNWLTMPVPDFLESEEAVPHLQFRLKRYCESL